MLEIQLLLPREDILNFSERLIKSEYTETHSRQEVLGAINISIVTHIRVSLSRSFSFEIIAYMYSNILNDNFSAAHATQRGMIK